MEENQLYANRYRLLKELGRGSFGEVWLALDEQLDDMQIAIKIYIALDAKGIEDFKAEFKNAYELNHPNLLHASHFDVYDNRPYLVMPFCPASSESLIGSIDESQLWKFIRDVASGLSYLHEHDIVHRDIKPDNILIDGQGNFLITDFGISKKMRSSLRRNSTRQQNGKDGFSGTIGYMGPEMFKASPEAVKATDIWALGATIFELATGELPFFGQGGVMLQHGAELPQLPSTFSQGLNSLVQACLAKEPWDRPQAADLINTRSNNSSSTGDQARNSEQEDQNLVTVIRRLEDAGQYKEAYNQCLECIRTNTNVEFAEKEMKVLIPQLKKQAKKDSTKQTVIIVIVTIIIGLISIFLSLNS